LRASAAREERTALRIYKDIASSRASVDCLSSKINSHLGRIARWQEEHRLLIESIALKKEISTKLESAPKPTDINPETSSQSSGRRPSPKDVVDLTCSETLTPERTPSPDILSYEIALRELEPWNDPELDVTGTMDYLELESLGWLTSDYLTLM